MRLPMLAFALASSQGLPFEARAEHEEILDVVGRQIEAINSDDFELAFDLISPDAKAMFGSFEDFGDLVRTGYPMVYRPRKYELLDLKGSGGATWQRVRFVDESGVNWLVDFKMMETPEGWTIDAFLVLPDASGGH